MLRDKTNTQQAIHPQEYTSLRSEQINSQGIWIYCVVVVWND